MTENIVKIFYLQWTVWNYEKFSLSLKKISSNHLFSNFFSKTNAFTKFLRKKCERISSISTLWIMKIYSLKNISSNWLFSKCVCSRNFRQNGDCEKISVISTVWKVNFGNFNIVCYFHFNMKSTKRSFLNSSAFLTFVKSCHNSQSHKLYSCIGWSFFVKSWYFF